jgi:hypothetical protein
VVVVNLLVPSLLHILPSHERMIPMLLMPEVDVVVGTMLDRNFCWNDGGSVSARFANRTHSNQPNAISRRRNIQVRMH